MMRATTSLLTTLLYTRASCSSHAYTSTLTSSTLTSSSSSSSSSIKKVAIIGGTHGNEYTGIWCVKSLSRQSKTFRRQYPSLDISTHIGNPIAFTENKRFVSSDLNREFSAEKLSRRIIDDDEQQQHDDGRVVNGAAAGGVEMKRARELNELLGPKFEKDGRLSESPLTDLIVDLHSTTTNMGMTLIIPENDPLITLAVAHILQHYPTSTLGPLRLIVHTLPDRATRPNLSSVAKHGLTVEVGPVPQGVLRHDAVEKTMAVVRLLLGFVQRWNEAERSSSSSSSSEEREEIMEELRRGCRNGRLPCFRSARARLNTEMSGKIAWGSDEDNPNFPNVMIHESIQDEDFKLIKRGDPMFVTLEGEVIPYNGSHGESVHLIFVNEGGYYYESSGRGVGVAVPSFLDLGTGRLVEEEEEEMMSGGDGKEDCRSDGEGSESQKKESCLVIE